MGAWGSIRREASRTLRRARSSVNAIGATGVLGPAEASRSGAATTSRAVNRVMNPQMPTEQPETASTTQSTRSVAEDIASTGAREADEERKRLLRRRGRASTILTSPFGTSSSGLLGYQTLMGG